MYIFINFVKVLTSRLAVYRVYLKHLIIYCLVRANLLHCRHYNFLSLLKRQGKFNYVLIHIVNPEWLTDEQTPVLYCISGTCLQWGGH